VRGLVGTAFHKQPADSPEYFSFALSVRDASAISGACLAMRKKDFLAIGGFDAQNTPINHSDVDLCFRVRERGQRCVYTPHTTLLHIGHLSLGDFEKKEQKKKTKDRSDVFLLKRWAGYTGTDPYYTEPMRNALYHDSPAPWRLYGENKEQARYAPGRDTLFISHELSDSGAPLVLYYAVEHHVRTGGFAVVLAPEEGPFLARFRELGVPVIVDSAALTRPADLAKLIAGFDLVVANTVVTWPLLWIAQQAGVPAIWYVHERGLVDQLAQANKDCRRTLEQARNLWVGSEHALAACRKYNPSARIMPYGVADLLEEGSAPQRTDGRRVLSTFASIEPRKGQDVLVRAIKALPAACRDKAVFHIVGRPLDARMFERLREEVAGLSCVQLSEGVELSEYRRLLRESDVIVCPSRDDTLPLVTLDALACAKVLVCTDTTGTSAFLRDGEDCFVVRNEDVAMLSACLERLIEQPELLPRVGARARDAFLKSFSIPAFYARFDAAVAEALGTDAPGAAAARPAGQEAQA
jgi:glycosyltransferase involved in cell wall biosynthesis